MKKIIGIIALITISCLTFSQNIDSVKLKLLETASKQQLEQLHQQIKNVEKNVAERKALIISELTAQEKFNKKADSLKGIKPKEVVKKPKKIK